MNAAHRVHLSDDVGTFNPDCEDCTDAVTASFVREWKAQPKPGYSSPERLMQSMSGWEWANTFAQVPDSGEFSVQIGWFSRALTAGYDAGYKAAQDQMRKRLGL